MIRPPQLARRNLSLTLVLVLSSLAGGCMKLRVPENNWFHPGAAVLSDSAIAANPLARGATLEDVHVAASDSTSLYALLVRTPGARVTVLYFGGDNFRIATGGAPLAAAASQLGVNALLVDYRGYGRSEGTPTLVTVKQDAVDVFDHLRALPAVGEVPIVVHGFSMGSFIGAHLATERPVAGLVLESTATNVDDWAHNFVPWYWKPFVRIEMAESLHAESNEERVRRYSGPLLLITGGEDRITTPAMARALYRISATPEASRHLVVVPGRGHGDALEDEAAGARYAAFLSSIAAPQ